MDRYNTEGYIDLTAYEALTNIEKAEKKAIFRPLVFICSPYAGEVEKNTAQTRRFCRHAVNCGYIPMAPHLHYPQFLNETDSDERSLGLLMGQVWLTKCAELWVFGNRISSGMEQEIRKAKIRNMFIRYFNENCEEVSPV